MKKGALAKVVGDFDSIDTEAFPQIESRLGEELRQTLEVGNPITDLNGNQVVKGRAAHQDAGKSKEITISPDGRIVADGERTVVDTETAEFLSVHGEYVLAKSTQASFVFDLIGSATGTVVEPMSVDIDGLIDDNPGAEYWMSGIYGRPGDIKTSDAYGDGDVFEDDDFGDIYRNSDKNRIGVKLDFESEETKILVTESGYIEVYSPTDFESLQFKRLIDGVILPHAF